MKLMKKRTKLVGVVPLVKKISRVFHATLDWKSDCVEFYIEDNGRLLYSAYIYPDRTFIEWFNSLDHSPLNAYFKQVEE